MEGSIELLLMWNYSCRPTGMMTCRHYVLGVGGVWGLCLFLSKFRGKVVPERERMKIKVKFVIVNSYCLMGDAIFISAVFVFQVATKPISKFKRARS